ncbi:NAD(P)/FAD-dependent oxidoreductase [Rubrobacter tropicus]|uniref:NAD(P)/FAD-dependent oxidoreductase n=1 Tax=Rubrobacter tropicus TaxID=2653851 RepID=UPI001A9CF8C3|nr:NAD(P)/FAD-dependent oxidoreductase [Rubrobacter tropicus]
MTQSAERFGAKTLDGDGRPRYDVVVVGAGAAGLSAALVLGRSGRKVLVLDGGEPRNAPAEASHGFFTRDGVQPGEMLKIGREQLGRYPNVEYRTGRATQASGADGAFEVTLEDGEVVSARKLVLATGVFDELPERPGFRELWGKGVYHCPYCHGWEMRGRPLAVLASPGTAFDRVALIRNWSRDLALLTDGEGGLSGADRRRLDALSVPVYEERISRLEGDPARPGGGLERVVFEGGAALEREGVFHVPPQRQRSGLAGSIGCELAAPVPTVEFVKADPMTRETTVAGVYAAGDAVRAPGQSVVLASASGAAAAYVLNHALAIQDAKDEVAAAPSAKGDLGRAAG